MTANELRIGNYVYDGSPLNEVLKIKAISEGSGFVDWVKPIQLTEDWLLKFGFDKPLHATWAVKNDFEIDLSFEFPCYHIFKNDFGNKVYLKYVHQIQNLYFALTNTELTLKQ